MLLKQFAVKTFCLLGFLLLLPTLTHAFDPPSTQAGFITVTGAQSGKIDISWTNGDGDARIVVVSEGSAVSAGPVDGTSYIADPTIGAGSELGDAGSGNWVVYDGTGNTATIAGITDNQVLYIQVFEYSTASGTEQYQRVTATDNPISYLNLPTLQVYIDDTNGEQVNDETNNPVNFGPSAVGVSNVIKFAIENTSLLDYTISSVTIGGSTEFSITTSPPTTISPGEVVAMEVDFKPSATGAFSGIVQIQSSTDDSYTFPVHGDCYNIIYYSRQSGQFDNPANWNSARDGVSGTFPNSTDFTDGKHAFVIQNPESINNADGGINIVYFEIEEGGSFDAGSTNASILGQTVVGGTFNDTDGQGSDIFGGRLTVQATGVFKPTLGELRFRGGIYNEGTCDLANDNTYFESNAQSVVANATIRNANNVFFDADVRFEAGKDGTTLGTSGSIAIADGVTVTNAGTLAFDSENLTGTGFITQEEDALLAIFANNITIGSFNLDASAAENTVRYNRSSGTQTIIFADYFHLEFTDQNTGLGTKNFSSGFMYIDGDLRVYSTVNLVGNIALAGDFDHSGTFSNFNAGTGGVEFVDFNEQIIFGSALSLYTMNLNKRGGDVVMQTDVAVTNDLLLGGVLDLGANTLQLSSSAAFYSFESGFDSNSMIRMDAGGVLRMETPFVADYLFPIGTGYVFSPALMDLQSATFSGAVPNFFELSLEATQSPDALDPDLALARYWDVTTVNITNVTVNMRFKYDQGDVSTDDANYKPAWYVNPSWSLGPLTDVDETNDTITYFMGGLPSLAYTYTAGEENAFFPAVKATYPAKNALDVNPNDSILIAFNTSMNVSTYTGNIALYGSVSGLLSGIYDNGADTLQFTPASPLIPGERITLVIDDVLQTTAMDFLNGTYTTTFKVSGADGPETPDNFLPSPDFDLTSTLTGAGHVELVDLDGNGTVDYLVSNGEVNTIAWYSNDGSGNFTETIISTTATTVEKVIAADLNKDGALDLIAAETGAPSLAYYLNDGSMNFTRTEIDNAVSGISDILAYDSDANGTVDIVAAIRSSNEVVIYFNDGSLGFVRFAASTAATGVSDIDYGDIDCDGDLDIVAGLSGSIVWLEQAGRTSFALNTIYSSTSGEVDVAVGDLLGDGTTDVLYADYSLSTASMGYLSNDGSQVFTWTLLLDVTSSPPSNIWTGDVDGDGDEDIVGTDPDIFGYIMWYENQGGLVFTAHAVDTVAATPAHAAAADIDGDGDVDIAAVSASGIHFLPNTYAAPAGQDSVLVFSNITNTSVDVSWTDGGGDGSLVLVSEGALVDGSPVMLSDYTASANYGAGDLLGTNSYVAYHGTGNSFTLTNLSAGNTYYLQVFAWDGTTAEPHYLYTTHTGNPDSVDIGAVLEVYNGSGISGTQITNGQSTITDFGTVVSGNTLDSTFTLYNAGSVDITVTGISMDNGTGFTVLTTPTTVTAGAFETFTVQFGGAVSFYQDSVIITSDDPLNPSFKFPVEGNIIDPVFYSQGGSLTFSTTSSWNTAIDGSGVEPTLADFTSGLGSFIIQDGDSLYLDTDSVSLFDLTIGLGGLLRLNTDGIMNVVSNTTTDSDIDLFSNAKAIFGGSLTFNSTANFFTASGTSLEFQNGLDFSGSSFRHQGLTSITTNAQTFTSINPSIIRLEDDVTIDADLTIVGELDLASATATTLTVNSNLVLDAMIDIGDVDVLGTGTVTLLDSAELVTGHASFQPTFDASASGTSVFFNGAGHTIDVPASTYHNLYFTNTTDPLNVLGDITVDNFANISTPDLLSNGFSFTFLGDVVTGASTHGDVSTFIFAGTALQEITTSTTSSEDTLVNVVISNPAGVTVAGSGILWIEGQLTLNGGNLIIADVLNLTETATVVDGGPGFSASNMIRFSGGAAELRQYTDNPGTWTWPIGRSGQYLPVTLTASAFTSAASGTSYLSAIAENTADPTALDASLALQNYWTLGGDQFTNLDMDLVLGYNDTEVFGDETNYVAAYTDGSSYTLGTTTDVDESLNTISFSRTGLDPTSLTGTYSAGEPAAFVEVSYGVNIDALTDAALTPGTTDVLVYSISIQETGGLVDAALDALTLDFGTGSSFSATDFNSFELYLSTDAVYDVGDTQLGSTLNPVDQTDQLAFGTTSFPASIPAGTTRYFLVIADVGSAASGAATFNIGIPTLSVAGIYLSTGTQDYFNTVAGATFTVSADPDVAVYQGEGITGTEVTDAQSTAVVFNSTAVTQETTRRFTIYNAGLSDLVIDTLTFTGTDFYISDEFPGTITAGGSDTISVTFAPSAQVTYQDTLVISSNDPDEASFRMPVQGTGTATPEPAITVYLGTNATGTLLTDADTNPVDFGTSTLGNPVTYNFAIENTGSATMSISSITLDNGAHYSIGGSPNLTIAVNGIETFTLTLQAGIVGVFPDVLHIISDVSGATGDFEINVTGEILGPDIAVYEGTDATGSPISNNQTTEIDLGTALLGDNLSTTIAIENPGTDNLTISNIQIGGAFYSIVGTITSIAPGSVATFDVLLDGSLDGTFKDTVRISSNDPEDSFFSFPITGRITATPEPDMQVYEGTGTGGTQLSSGSTAINFGSIAVGSTSTVNFTIENAGIADLNIAGITYTGSFVESTSPATTIAAGATTNFAVSFTGTVPGVFSGSATFVTNNPAGDFVINFTVEVVAPEIVVYQGAGTGGTQVASGATTIDFGSILQGSTASRQFTIENAGTADLSLTGIRVSDPAFTVSGTTATTLAPGTTSSFTLNMAGTSIGTYGGSVTISNNDQDEGTFSFAVTGQVRGAKLIVIDGDGNTGNELSNGQGDPVNLGQTPLNSNIDKVFTINNDGTDTLFIESITINTIRYTIVGAPEFVAPGQTQTFTVRLIADEVGAFDGEVTIVSSTGTFTFPVSGEVITTGLPPVSVVNGITPDGDGIHEYLRIRNIGSYPNNTVKIYNRWGDLVWEIEGYNNDEPGLRFDGNSNKGGLGVLADGTYYYVINPDKDVDNVSGFILLRR